MRRSLAKLTSSNDSSDSQDPDKYRLLVTAGPGYDTSQHQIVPVNGDGSVTISNEFMTAKVKVRIRGYRGLPTGSPASNTYFEDPVHKQDQYSVAFSFVPKKDLPSLDTVWGNDFDHPIRNRLPPGFNTAFKIVKEFIDPGLSCDAYADEPWLYGPSLSCWFAFRIGDLVEEGKDFPAPSDEDVMKDGADGSGEEIRQELSLPDDNEKRRKFFLKAPNREKLVFQKGRLYSADFYNPYLDFGNLALKLPGFSIKVFKYIDAKSHRLRYVFKNRETGDMYLNVNFNLLWGDGLQAALDEEKNDQQGGAKAGGQAASSSERKRDDTKKSSDEQLNKKEEDKVSVPTEDDKDATSPAQQPQKPAAPSRTPSAADEIERLLAATSTADMRGERIDILNDDVD